MSLSLPRWHNEILSVPTLEIAVGNIRFFWRVFHDNQTSALLDQSVVRWKYSVNFKFNNYRKFNGACYVSIFRNLCGLATNKCCVVGTLISTQFSQIFVRFTWERFHHRRIFTSLWIKKKRQKRQNKTKQKGRRKNCHSCQAGDHEIQASF